MQRQLNTATNKTSHRKDNDSCDIIDYHNNSIADPSSPGGKSEVKRPLLEPRKWRAVRKLEPLDSFFYQNESQKKYGRDRYYKAIKSSPPCKYLRNRPGNYHGVTIMLIWRPVFYFQKFFI